MKFESVLLAVSILFIGISAVASNDKTFEIPRTKIVVIQDSGTKRFYELHIQMPREYTTDKKYPVVYMTDSLYTFPITAGAARFPINFGKMENVMFVGISWETNFRPDLSRQRDYTPTDSSPGFRDASGQADKHLAFIRNDVMHYIDRNYSTDITKKTYVGNSFGGLLGAYILLTEPETFDNYILGSPSIWWDNKYILKLASQTDKLTANVSANVFIAVGSEETARSANTKHDMVVDARAFHAQLKSRNLKNLSLKLQIIDSANHVTAFPTTAIQGMWWLFKTNI